MFGDGRLDANHVVRRFLDERTKRAADARFSATYNIDGGQQGRLSTENVSETHLVA
jgi:hypothetical protein